MIPRFCIAFFLFAAMASVSSYCPAEATELQTTELQTTVAPLANEDIASPCHYSLKIPAAPQTIRATWVIFDRARDVHNLYTDPAILAFCRRFRIALLLHGHCPGKLPEDRHDMNMDPSKGLGPALFRALDQFAVQSGHRELSPTNLIFLGFSGAGPLSARLAASAPDRSIAAILSAPGHFEPLGIDTVNVSSAATSVPELIIAGGADNITGTARPYMYFRKYRDQGAPWVFILQNRSPHCCTGNVRDLMIRWLAAIIEERQHSPSDGTLRSLDQRRGWLLFVKTKETDTTDSFGLKTFNAIAAKIESSSTSGVPQGWQPVGWVPNRRIAKEWLSFVEQKQHPVLPLH